MTQLIIPAPPPALESIKARSLDTLGRRLLLNLLNKIELGRITLVENGRALHFGNQSPDYGLRATIHIHHPRFYSKTVFGGSMGAGDAYMAGMWSSDDLTAAVRIVIRNQQLFLDLDRGWGRLMAPLQSAYHVLRRNTRRGSRDNILAHYDLGNDFYRLFLDETMTYSCGIFEDNNDDLSAASVAKYDRICRKIKLVPGDRVIEIGTGWGGFALHAARNYGAHVTTTTLSDQQYRYVEENVRNAGLEGQIHLLQKDYRDLTGQYDKLVSIEMIEAVGHQYLGVFFNTCSRLLKADGIMALQAITIVDHAFDQHVRSVDFIRRYIFPGGCIPSVAAMAAAVAAKSDLRPAHLEDLTLHYARTLDLWRQRFLGNLDAVRALGFPESFIRMWEYYLCYCEAGFRERYIGNVQMLFTKPLHRGKIYPE
ncbi:MAG: cyclopropane-fatty-acyl-phospholipid synthase family protein [Desulfobacterales bacterium]